MLREGRRVMVFSAHAADFCSRAGGTIARLVDLGGTVNIYDMTFGERCESPGLYAQPKPPSIEEIKKIRWEEMQQAAETLGAMVQCFDFGDSPLIIDTERRHQITNAIRSFKPDLVLSHWHNDILHPDHVETTKAVIWACRYCDAPGVKTKHPWCEEPDIMCYEATLGTAPISKFIPDLYVDITSTFDRKMEALRHLATQPKLPGNYAILARYRGLEAKTSANMKACIYAEGFCRVVG
jgi:4-oxalomesaconate hydratase